MEDIKRLMLECRFILSLNKSYDELSRKLNVNREIIYYDLNNRLRDYDTILYKKVLEKLKNI